jgi:apolipoprotein N-acyltransferase
MGGVKTTGEDPPLFPHSVRQWSVTLRSRMGRLTRPPWRIRWLTLLAGGAVAILVFPEPNLEWLAWFGLVPGLWLITRAASLRDAWVRAWWFGTGYAIAAMYWMAPEIGPGLVLLGAVLGFLWVPFGLAAWKLLRPPVSWGRAGLALVVVPSCWLLGEWIRSWQALGGPWDVYGASQWQHPAVLALAAIGGVWLVTFALVAVNVALFLIVTEIAGSTRRLGIVAAGLGLAVVFGGAGPLAYALTPPFPAVRQVTIALVQPGLVSNSSLQSHASQTLTEEFSRGGTLDGVKPDLIVWGESSIDEDLTLASNRALLRSIEALSAKDGADILVNQDAIVAGKGHEKWAVLVSPSGIKGIYVKTRLVPFGEYIPFRQQLGWLTLISKAASTNMIPGTGAHLIHATTRTGAPLPIGVLICFESTFPDMARVDADLGAQVIVYQSATSTFQGTWGPDQQASLGALRAAETGRPVVQAALTGDSAAFDARGRQIAWLGQSQHGVVTVRLALPSASARTFYDSHGDYVPWAATVVAVLSALMLVFLRRKTGGSGGGGAQYESSNPEFEAAGEGEPRR